MRTPIPAPHGKSILLVDDDADVREATVDLLVDMGYFTVSADGGAQALSLFERGLKPSVILLDLSMPEMDGETLLLKCRDLPQLVGVPRVFISGTKQPPGILERTGACEFLAKPVNDKKLADVLDRLGVVPESYPALS